MNEHQESLAADSLLSKAYKFAGFYTAEHDLDAAAVAVLVRAIELTTGRTVNMETMYDIRIE
jgi:hypothetical protein